MIRVCPSAWEEHNYLLRQSLLTKLSPLCDTLEQNEKIQASKKRDSDAAIPGDKGGAKQKTRFASDSTKHNQVDGSKAYRIPKQPRNEKFYKRCKEHGGAHKTHNTSECHRYAKDGTPQLATLKNKKALVHVEATSRDGRSQGLDGMPEQEVQARNH